MVFSAVEGEIMKAVFNRNRDLPVIVHRGLQ